MVIDNSKKYIYRGYTLIDITDTGVVKNFNDKLKERNQQRNWETVLQVLNMRTQLFRAEQTQIITKDLKGFQFGSAYNSKHKVWVFEFETEHQDVIPLNDFDSVPIISGLDETAKPAMNLFFTDPENKNIYFEII